MLLTFFSGVFPSVCFSLAQEVQKYDETAYSAIASSKNLIYLAECSRSKLKQFEWKVWEENWMVRARIQPIATIVVRWDKEDPFLSDAELFIRKAVESSLSIGGHILCMVQLERDRKTLMVKSISFRAYRQLFVSGNQNWESYLNELVSKELPLTLEDFQAMEKRK